MSDELLSGLCAEVGLAVGSEVGSAVGLLNVGTDRGKL